jgi:7-cyano-7-deazaguanine synthase
MLRINAVAIVSGGLDSVTLLHYLVKVEGLNPAAVTYLYGQKHGREVDFARQQAALVGVREHQVLDLSALAPLFGRSALVAADVPVPAIEQVVDDAQPPTYVPNRNMIFLALAAAHAETLGSPAVYYGAQRHDLYGYWDTTPKFLSRLNQLLALNRKTTIEIKAPFVNYSKADILRLGLELGIDYSLTWSCYQGHSLACGRCPTCAERLAAFAEVGLVDPLPYQQAA